MYVTDEQRRPGTKASGKLDKLFRDRPLGALFDGLDDLEHGMEMERTRFVQDNFLKRGGVFANSNDNVFEAWSGGQQKTPHGLELFFEETINLYVGKGKGFSGFKLSRVLTSQLLLFVSLILFRSNKLSDALNFQ